MGMRSLEPFINRKIVVLHETDSAFQATKAMANHGIGCVVVSDADGRMTGIVTDRDIALRLVAGGLSPVTPLREIMTSELASVLENSNIDEVIELMAEYGIRRIPVLRPIKAGRERCVGLVSLDDLIMAGEISPEKLKAIVRGQVSRRYGRTKSTESSEASIQFVKELANKLNTTEEAAEEFAHFVFLSIARRLNYSAAVQFILQLPYDFQVQLFDFATGPDRSITAQSVIREAAEKLQIPPEGVQLETRKLWELMMKYGDREQLRHTWRQLPSDLQELLTGPESSIRQDPGEWVQV